MHQRVPTKTLRTNLLDLEPATSHVEDPKEWPTQTPLRVALALVLKRGVPITRSLDCSCVSNQFKPQHDPILRGLFLSSLFIVLNFRKHLSYHLYDLNYNAILDLYQIYFSSFDFQLGFWTSSLTGPSSIAAAPSATIIFRRRTQVSYRLAPQARN